MNKVEAVSIAMRMLTIAARARQPISIPMLASALCINESKASRYLRTLQSQGYISSCKIADFYQIGPKLSALAVLVNDSFDLADAASGTLRDLRNRLGSTSVLSEVENDSLCVLTSIQGRSSIAISVKHGSRLPLHASAQGKLVLAFGDQAIRRSVFQRRLNGLTPETITSRAVLWKELRIIKEQGWAVAPGQAMLGMNALAAPVFDAVGTLAAALAIFDTTQFIQEVPTQEQIACVTKAAAQISAVLGCVGDALL